MVTTGIKPLTWSTLSNACGGKALTSTWMTLTSADVRGTRTVMSRAATSSALVVRVLTPVPVPAPLRREPRNTKMPRATTAMTAPMIVKGRPLIWAAILEAGNDGSGSIRDLGEALGCDGSRVVADRKRLVALGRVLKGDDLGEVDEVAGVAVQGEVAAGPVIRADDDDAGRVADLRRAVVGGRRVNSHPVVLVAAEDAHVRGVGEAVAGGRFEVQLNRPW